MCQVQLKHRQLGQAAKCIGTVVAVTVVTGWALAQIKVVCWDVPQQVAADIFMVGLDLALLVGVTLVHP